MPEKSRYPAHEFSHADYLGWICRVRNWLNTQIGKPDYPAHLAGDLAGRIDEFKAALSEWNALRSAVGGKHKVYDAAFKALYKQVAMVKKLLPLLALDEPVMGEFRLIGRIERDRDHFHGRAQGVANKWNELCSPDPPVEYEPLKSELDKVVELFDDFDSARKDYFATLNTSQQAQNLVLTTRTACHKAERKIFRWYRAHHPKTTGEWWTATEWGTSRGKRKKDES